MYSSYEHLKSHSCQYGAWDYPDIWMKNNIFLLSKDLEVFKKVAIKGREGREQNAIAVLTIPAGALVQCFRMGSLRKQNFDNPTGTIKLRASMAFVERIETIGARNQLPREIKKSGIPYHPAQRDGTEYKPGYLIAPKKNYSLGGEECASGIHFFLHREVAKGY